MEVTENGSRIRLISTGFAQVNVLLGLRELALTHCPVLCGWTVTRSQNPARTEI